MPGGFGWNSTFFLQLGPPDFWSSGLRAPDSLQIPSFLCFRPLLADSLPNFGLLPFVLAPTKAKKWAQEGQDGPKMPGWAAKVGKTASVNGSRTPGISMAGCFSAFLLLPALAFGFSAKFWAASFCFYTDQGEKWAQEGANIGPQRPWQAAKVEKTACVNGSRTPGISMAGCFYAFLLLPATDFGFSAKIWAASFCFDTGPGEKMGPRRAKMGPRCQWRRLRLRGWHRILCKIPWEEVLVHRSPVRKYFSSSPWAAQGAKFEG